MSWSSNAEVDLPGDASSDEDDCNDDDEAAGDSSEECDENGISVELEVDGECIGFNVDVEIREMSRTTVASPEAELPATGPGVVSEWTSFKIVGDNVDKNVRPSNQRIDHQTVLLHYFHAIAVRDRIDFSSLSDIAPEEITIDPDVLLPTSTDLELLTQEFEVLVARYSVCVCVCIL